MRYRLVLAGVVTLTLFAQKRPITHKDYDSWRSIRSQQLSRDGKFLAYGLFPQEGDGELLIRNLTTGKEWRESVGQPPPPPRANTGEPEEGTPQPRGISIAFTKDGRYVVASTFPARADTEKARREKKRPADMPKNGLIIVELTSGAAKRIDRVKSLQTAEDGPSLAVWQLEPARPADRTSPIVVRNLATNVDRQIDAVSEYSLSKDGKTLIYTAGAVFAVDPSTDAQPAKLADADGRFTKLTWNDAQTQLAFVTDRNKLYLWDRGAAAANVVVTAETPGFQKGFVISASAREAAGGGEAGAGGGGRGGAGGGGGAANLSFSKDGGEVFLSCAPAPKPATRNDDLLDDEKVSMDLWHWKDDYIQPMQKVRANAERTRSYRAVYHIAEKKFVQLASPEMSELVPNDDGRWAIGGDDREYRAMVEYDARYRDSYLVNTMDGTRHLLAKKHLGNISWSPDGKYALMFDGHDWNTISVPERKSVNLTAKLGVRFFREDDDHPGAPPPYAPAAWTKDGKFVLLYDHFDIWRVAPDGSSAQNLTAGFGRKNRMMLRAVRLDADPRDRGIDASKPLLLRAENEDTRESGFFRTSIDATQPPSKLVMAAKNFTAPTKAKEADVLLLTESTFNEFPDLQTTDMSFKELRRVSHANPQKDQFLWGSAELVGFKNVDGVPLKSVLYKPDNFDPKKKYPMLVYIYERLSQGLNTFVEPKPGHSINVSYYVSNGYLVLEPDIAYKVGFPGQSALKCVLPAIQAVVDQGFVDEKAIGIQGHSWGGYQIAYMITQTDRFKAVAAGAPVANMVSAYNGIRWGPGLPRQFQYEKTQSRIGGTLWEYPMRFIENSPIFMADRVKTPLMMLHNDADDAVPWYQGIEYYLALRRLNKEVYLFTYNGEPHGLRRRPNQKDYTVRLQEYFDHYLKGAPKPSWMERGIPYIESHPAPARGQAAPVESSVEQ